MIDLLRFLLLLSIWLAIAACFASLLLLLYTYISLFYSLDSDRCEKSSTRYDVQYSRGWNDLAIPYSACYRLQCQFPSILNVEEALIQYLFMDGVSSSDLWLNTHYVLRFPQYSLSSFLKISIVTLKFPRYIYHNSCQIHAALQVHQPAGFDIIAFTFLDYEVSITHFGHLSVCAVYIASTYKYPTCGFTFWGVGERRQN